MEPGSTVWSDYDGNAIYGDYEVVFTEDPPESGNWTKEIVETTAYLPGIAQMDRVTGDVVYFHTDQIGTVRAISSSSASRPHFLVSTAFGERVHVDGTVGTRYQYAGAFGYETLPAWDAAAKEYLDDEAVPFLHVGYRYYNPETGRFLQRDPIGTMGGLNVYEYSSSLPTSRVDAEGLMSLRRPPSATGPADVGMFDWFWTKVHYGAGWLGGMSGLKFSTTIRSAIKWELVEPNIWPGWNESFQNQVGDVIVAGMGWCDAQRIRRAIKEIIKGIIRRAQEGYFPGSLL